MSTFASSIVRTIVPIVVGWLLSLAVVSQLGISEDQVTQAVTAVVTAVYYVAARAVEVYVAPRVGALLIGLGVAGPVSYGRHEAA